jgi:hypothetical protein
MWPFSGKQVEPARAFAHLRPGHRYHVVKPFIDHDGICHSNGEMWTFVGSAFLPYEDGLTLDVVWADGLQRTIRLQRRPDAEGPVIDAIESHIAEDLPPGP